VPEPPAHLDRGVRVVVVHPGHVDREAGRAQQREDPGAPARVVRRRGGVADQVVPERRHERAQNGGRPPSGVGAIQHHGPREGALRDARAQAGRQSRRLRRGHQLVEWQAAVEDGGHVVVPGRAVELPQGAAGSRELGSRQDDFTRGVRQQLVE
jgi:hypothetical protein